MIMSLEVYASSTVRKEFLDRKGSMTITDLDPNLDSPSTNQLY